MNQEALALKSMKERKSNALAKRSLLDDEIEGLDKAINALEKQLGKTSIPSGKKSSKKNFGRKERREKIISAIIDFLKKNGDCKSKDVQEHLETIGLYEAGAAGNQSSLSRLLADETANQNSLIQKEQGGFISLRK